MIDTWTKRLSPWPAGGCFAAGYLMHYHSPDATVVGLGIPFANGFAVVIQVKCGPLMQRSPSWRRFVD